MPNRRLTKWVDTLVQSVVTPGTQVQVELLNAAALIDTEGWTITRVIGELAFASTSTAGAYGSQIMDLGLGVISREGVVGGVFPDPDAQEDEPTRGWLYRTRCTAFQNGTGTPIWSPSCKFDIHAQRRVENGRFYLIFDALTLRGTAFSTDAYGIIRTLVLLP